MAYKNTIPASADLISKSQPEMKENFKQIKTLVDIDHVTFADPSGNQGKHKKVTLPQYALGAAPTTAADEIALFSRDSVYTSKPELNVRKESDGTITEFTSYGQSDPGNIYEGEGWTRLPSNILVKWGFKNLVNGSNPIVFPAAANIPAFTNVYMYYAYSIGSATSAGGLVSAYACNAPYTTLTVYSTGVTKAYYFVIGV